MRGLAAGLVLVLALSATAIAAPIVQGYWGGRCRPEQSVTRDQMAEGARVSARRSA